MKYSIGEFSRMTALSIKSLRLYHEKELLIPAEVDQWTGYRFYDEKNYETVRAIQLLKSLDFALAEIKEILAECSQEEDALVYLERKLGEVRRKIEQYDRISHQLKLTIQFERERTMNSQESFEVEEKNVDTLLIAGYRMKGKYGDVGEGFKRIGQSFGRHVNGKAMTLYYDNDYKEEGADFEACFPIRKGTSSSDISVRELPGGKCVAFIHKGPYERIGESYKVLFDYIQQKGYRSKLPSREVYIKGPGMIFRGNPNNYITEIQVFIEE
jgi:DNA-binding transcriptional MerR regulator